MAVYMGAIHRGPRHLAEGFWMERALGQKDGDKAAPLVSMA